MRRKHAARVGALFEAELSECSMNGNLCGESTGEALSRWCSAVIGNNALADFATAPQWVQDGMANWVDTTEDTDQDGDSIGCGMAFISWLISQGHGLEKIAPAMVSLGNAGTLAQLYANLTGRQRRETPGQISRMRSRLCPTARTALPATILLADWRSSLQMARGSRP